MDSASIQTLLGHLKAKNVKARGKWVQCSCPLAPFLHDSGKDSSPSFAVRVEDNKSSYFNCFVCEHGDLGNLIVRLQFYKAQNLGYDLGAAWKLVQLEAEQKIDLIIKDWGEKQEDQIEYAIPDWWLDSFQEAWTVPYARQYLEQRMVSGSIADTLDIRWDRSLRTVCFPVRNGAGELVSLRGRRISPRPDQPSYHVYPFMGHANTGAWLGEHLVDYDKPVCVAESVFDLTSVFRVYRNVISPMTVGFNATRVKRIAKGSEYVTLFDHGTGGDKARSIMAKSLKGAMLNQIIPPKDKGDAGSMQEDELRQLLSDYLPLLPVAP